MKKILLTACALCAFGVANANNVFQIAPLSLSESNPNSEIVITVSGDGTAYSGNMDFYVPNGITVNHAGAVAGEGLNGHGMVVKRMTDDVAGYQHYQLMITISTKTAFTAPEVCRVPVIWTNEVANGLLNIKMTKCKTASTAGTSGRGSFTASTSYIKVGTGDFTFAPEGNLTEAVSEALATDTEVKNIDLSKVTVFEGAFPYMAGRNVTAVPAVKANAKVVASCADGYASLVSPYDLDGVSCYVYDKVENGVAFFNEATSVPAGEVVIIAAAVEETVANATLVTVAGSTASTGCYLKGGELYKVNGTVTVPALRGTFDIAAASNLRIALETPTGIQMIGTANEVFGNTYDLQGRQVENAHNGVYVVNGKKQFVK